jgi:DNA-binding MarR family transcriptional regulator
MSAAGLQAPEAPAMENPFSPAVMAAFRSRPDFPRHVMQLACTFIDQFVGNRFLNLITNDRGRIQVAHAALYLHYTRDPNDPASGLTPSRLKAFCAQHRMCSPGRTAAMLAVMQMSGHVVDAPAPKDRRIRLLMPTPKLVDTFLSRWISYFDALAEMMPETAGIARAARESEVFLQAYLRHIVESYIAGYRLMNHVPPQLTVFADANAGVLIFLSLFAAAGKDGPPSGGQHVQIAISELARRFAVSRAHVKQVLKNAQEKGLLVPDDGSGNGIYLTPELIDGGYQWFAAMFALELHAGNTALQAARAASRGA